MRRFLKKLQFIVMILLLITIAVGLIYLGFYYAKISSKRHAFATVIDRIANKYVEIAKTDDKYNLGDNFTIDGKSIINLNSEEYTNKGKTDQEYLKKNNILKNLTKMDIHYLLAQDVKKGKGYIEINETIGPEKIVEAKYLVDDSTGYYYADGIVSEFVNGGNNNYFEMFKDEDYTTKSNKNYLYYFFREALKKSIKEEYLSGFKTETNIGNNRVSVGEVSLKLDDKTLKKILNNILYEFKHNKRASQIMNSIDPKFSKRKIPTERIIPSNESYSINIYTSRYLYEPLKIEVIYLKDDEQKVYSYEGDENNGTFYYSENTNLKYNATYKGSEKNNTITFHNSANEEVGTIITQKDVNNTIITVNLALDEKKYDLTYTSKYKDYKKNKSYAREDNLTLKIMDQMVNKLSGDIKFETTITKGAKIDVDITNSILESTVPEETLTKFKNLTDIVRERLEK